MLTALRSEAQERISYEIGVDEYLCKPFDEVILRLRIRNILALRQKYKSMFSTSMNCETLNINASSKDNTFMTSAINLMKEHYADSDYNLERFIRDMGIQQNLSQSEITIFDRAIHWSIHEKLPIKCGKRHFNQSRM